MRPVEFLILRATCREILAMVQYGHRQGPFSPSSTTPTSSTRALGSAGLPQGQQPTSAEAHRGPPRRPCVTTIFRTTRDVLAAESTNRGHIEDIDMTTRLEPAEGTMVLPMTIPQTSTPRGMSSITHEYEQDWNGSGDIVPAAVASQSQLQPVRRGQGHGPPGPPGPIQPHGNPRPPPGLKQLRRRK